VRSYLEVVVRIGHGERHLLWFSDEDRDDLDQLLLDDDGQLVAFGDGQALRAYAAARSFPIAERGPARYDLDALAGWLQQPTAAGVRCRAFLDAWNLFIDLRSTLTGRNAIRDPDGAGAVYDQLFHGSNLPAMTSARGEPFVPQWTDADLAALVRVLGGGLQLFRSRLAAGETPSP
jgi:hypothetical protein